MFIIASVIFPLLHSDNIVYVPQSFMSVQVHKGGQDFYRVVLLPAYTQLTHSTNEPRLSGWVATLLTVVMSIDCQVLALLM